jgi:hypothetical protein
MGKQARDVWYPERRLGKPELASPRRHYSGLRWSLGALALLLERAAGVPVQVATPTECRGFADQCDRLAKEADNPERRRRLSNGRVSGRWVHGGNYRWPGGSGRAAGAKLANETGLLPTVSVLGFLRSCAGLQMASSALSHNTSGLRCPVLAGAMSLSAMVRLTWSSSSPVLTAMQAISRAIPRARLVSRSK